MKICVIGAANVDICGTSRDRPRQFDSNPGTVDISFGGVGRNIAHTLARLGADVEFVASFSDDYFGRLLLEDCKKRGLDCNKSKIVSDVSSSIYLAVLDELGDMCIGINDMRIIETLTEDDLRHAIEDLTKADALVLDANFSEDIILYLAKNARCIKAVDPVSASKAPRLTRSLPYIDIMKPNRIEAHAFNGIEITDEISAVQSLDWFLEKGVKEIIISLSDMGVLLATKDYKYWFRHRTPQIANATGAGDSFLGAYLTRRLSGISPCESIRFAISSSVTTIETDINKRENISFEIIEKNIDSMQIHEIRI